MMANLGITGAGCLTERELESLGNLTLNELRGLAHAQKLLPNDEKALGGV